jgi:hypothetical protein
MKAILFSKSGITTLLLSAIALAIWAIAGCGLSYNSAAGKSLAEPSLPIITCIANPTSVISGTSVQIAARAMSPLGLPLSYSYGATAGSVTSHGASATLDTQGTTGSITVTCKVVDTQGNAASSTTTVAVQVAESQPPTVSCSANPAAVTLGGGVAITAVASSPEDRPLSYSWSASSGTISGTGNVAALNTNGAAAGVITVTCRVVDSQGLTASATTPVTVSAPVVTPGPVLAPTISCSASPSIINQGGAAAITAIGSSPLGLPLSYSYSASAGSIRGSGTTGNLQTAGAPPGTVIVTCTVEQQGGGSASAIATVIVQSTSGEQAASADSFVDSIGVATHLSYDNTPYFTAWPQVLRALQTLGVRHIRDGYYDWPSSSPFVTEHQALAAVGIHCTYVIPLSPATDADSIEQFSPLVRDMEALESPNECDVPGNCNGNGPSGVANAVNFLPTIHAAATKLKIPILGPSFVEPYSYAAAGNISSEITDNNLHMYFGGRNPGSTGWGGVDPEGNSYGSFAYWLDQAATDAPGLPVEITESGYIAYPTTTTPYTLPESVEASYTPRTLLLAFQHGIKRTFLYELLDEVSSPGYGILRSDLTSKPAYSAVENLISSLSDKGSSFSPGKLSYSIEGGGASLNHLLLQKQDGSFWLVMWLEVSSFDPATLTPEGVTPEQIMLTVEGYHPSEVLRWDTLGKTTSEHTNTQASQLSLSITDQISIVKVDP